MGDLDPYILEFEEQPTVAVEWLDVLNNKTYYSLIVQVAQSYVILELMSAKQTLLPTLRYRAPVPRFAFGKGEVPEDYFYNLGAMGSKGRCRWTRGARAHGACG